MQEIDASFLGEHLGLDIHEFHYERIGADRGMLGEIYKVTIKSSTGSREVVAKFSAPRKEALDNAKRGGTHERELRCYDELLSTTPVSIPEIFASWFDEKSSEYLIIQEFIEFDQSVDQIDGITIAQSKLVIEEAAAMHAHWWEHSGLAELKWLPRLNDTRRRTNLTTVTRLGWNSLTEILDEGGLSYPEVSGDSLANEIDDMLCDLSTSESTLIHSDLRADNLLFNTVGDGVMLVDWQGCSFGPSSFDITYHMIQSLSVDDRRKHESELLDYYVNSLEFFGHQITIDEVHKLYRSSILYSLSIACAVPLINDVESPRVKELAFSMASRTLAALEDHDIDFGAENLT
ncbi:MAG: oxidoreductase family protein, partial [Actinomycetota bacterium]|nr:oxidoreductase family protein [Actinomycetota bacterium]